MATAYDLNSGIAPPLQLHRFSVEQYHRLGEMGVLTPEDKVELLEGWIAAKMNQRPVHGYIVGLLNELFVRQLPPGWICRCQLPITTERSEPEPDIAIVQGMQVDYRDGHPSGTRCRLIIEVADTSLDKDRLKAAIYCSAGVPEYWIVNINAKCVERFVGDSPQPAIVHADSQISIQIDDTAIEIDLKHIFE